MRTLCQLLLALFVVCFASTTARSELSLESPIPVTPNVRIGKLDNGLTYYIRKNAGPENRIEMQLDPTGRRFCARNAAVPAAPLPAVFGCCAPPIGVTL